MPHVHVWKYYNQKYTGSLYRECKCGKIEFVRYVR